MSAIPNEHRRNGTGVPGIRLRERQRGKRVVLELDVSWYAADGQRRFTSYVVKVPRGGVKATERAMRRREHEAGVKYDITPRQAWHRLNAF